MDVEVAVPTGELYKDAKSIFRPLIRIIKHANNLESNYNRLIVEKGTLIAQRNDIVAKANKHKTKELTKKYEHLLSRVRKIEEDVAELEAKYKEVEGKNTLITLYPRSKLSRRMVNKCEEVRNLQLELNIEAGVLVEKSPEPVRTMHARKTEGQPSFHWAIEKALDLLRDKDIKRIGLWGIPGIGKTTLMKSLNDNQDIAKMFEIVIFVEVKNRSIKMLQDAIAQRLKLDVEGITDTDAIASRISKELECQRYLLLFDEVQNIPDLHAIGIHDNDKDSKVVFATRYRDSFLVMETIEEIELKCLSENDAYKMFKEIVGENMNLPDVEPIAKLIARYCAGWPLLIDRVAKIFRMKDRLELWRDGHKSLLRWPNIKFKGMDDLIDLLKSCYEALDCEEKKFCFLYSTLYPEDFEIYIDYLLECWRAEGFIDDAVNFRVARDSGHTILNYLISVSLLERTDSMNYVRVNKVLRNMAFQIYSGINNFKVLVRSPQEQQQPPDEVEWQHAWQHANRISLMDNEFYLLPERPNCENLSTLLLQRNRDLTLIPESFFELMQNLRVLDLQGTGITSLPSSISICFKCLKALYLNACDKLMELPFNIEESMPLEVLDIRNTRINYLPIQIGCLNQLKCLRMSLSRGVEFGRNFFSELSSLEELSIDVDPPNQGWEEVVTAIIKEVATLKCLTSLSICFPNVDCLQDFISTSPSWKDTHSTFQFSVGHYDSTKYQILDYSKYQIRRCLKFVNGEDLPSAILEVLANAHAFELINHKGASSLSGFGIKRIKNMYVCLINGCKEIETIVDSLHLSSLQESALELLKVMYIYNVPKLASIWEGPVHAGSLARLETLILCKCLSLKKIFSNSMIAQLSKLQNLKVEECHEIEEVIMESENKGLEPDVLPSLKTLVLLDLPKVRSIWINDSIKWSSLKKIAISMCPLLTKLPFSNENAINLECIEVQRSWWNALKWQQEAIEERLRSICSFN